ncbi:MAG: sulfotransferase, partial [Gammaproteobacteria bacterium]|nr:sulfotransferase [Gammaproteobacteria bacterium]
MTDKSLILLFGMPRSGTTWLGKVLDSHPNTLYRHEPDSKGRLADMPLLPTIENEKNYRDVVQRFAENLPEINDTKVAASLPVFQKRYYSFARYQLYRGMAWLAKAASKGIGEISFPLPVSRRALNSVSIVWKSIESVGRIGVIEAALPEAKIILVVRHPCGYIASVLRGEKSGKFSGSHRTSEDYGMLELLLKTPQACRRGLTRELLEALSPVERLAWRWVLFNEKAMEEMDGKSHCTYVSYDSICDDPVGGARNLLEFSGLNWNLQTE